MKIPFKAIAILIVLSLIGVFAYQAYWLTNLYTTMKKDMDICLLETLQISDYNELMVRCDSLSEDSTVKGSIESSYSKKSNTIITETHIDSGEVQVPKSYGLSISEPTSSTIDKNGTVEMLTKYFQRGIHSQLDLFTEINLRTYDSIFCHSLSMRALSTCPTAWKWWTCVMTVPPCRD